MNLIDGRSQGEAKFGPGHFDLVVIDEAHRSVYQRFRAIFDYFDAFLVGLTATPKDEIDKNTYSLFDLEDGVPTDAYSLAEAVDEGYLVPPKAISVPLKIVRQGLRYDDLSEEEKDRWDSLEWGEDEIPDTVQAAEVNKRLFNADTVDHVIAHLMENGVKVEGGDRLGKTIVFAKNQDHAQFIEQRFDKAYPKLAGKFARVITHQTGAYAQTLIDAFSGEKGIDPHIAISVDMLDTGIDVPAVANLVFFKPVRSKTKFWQMMGRGTRLCKDLFGPGQDKEFFRVFDYCENLEFFGADPEIKEAGAAKSLSARLFTARVDLVQALDRKNDGGFGEGISSIRRRQRARKAAERNRRSRRRARRAARHGGRYRSRQLRSSPTSSRCRKVSCRRGLDGHRRWKAGRTRRRDRAAAVGHAARDRGSEALRPLDVLARARAA